MDKQRLLRIILAIFLLGIHHPSYSQEFSVNTDFDIPDANSIELGDFDNDNDLDILTTHGFHHPNKLTLAIYENREGKFELKEVVLDSVFVKAIWGDFNNDDKLDILCNGYHYESYEPFTCILNRKNDSTYDTLFYTKDEFINFSSLSSIDFNNDGNLDFFISGEDDTFTDKTFSELYKNNGDNTFTKIIDHGIPKTYQASTDWADFNNDGFQDLLISANTNLEEQGTRYITEVLVNNGDGKFSMLESSFTDVANGTSKWYDIDDDGDFDIISTGRRIEGYFINIYLNNNGNFIETTLAEDYGLDAVTHISGKGISILDFNNDGKKDFFLSGRGGGDTNPSPVSNLYENINNRLSLVQNSGIEENYNSLNSFGDINNDGDQDLIVLNSQKPIFYENSRGSNSYKNNTKPLPPTILESKTSVSSLLFTWNEGNDQESENQTLDYSIYVGTSPKNQNIYSTVSNLNTGFRKTLKSGNSTKKRKTIELNHEGNIYWGVQSIDGAFTGSNFSSEQSLYFIKGTHPTFTVLNEPLRVKIEWIDNSAIESSYQLYKSVNSNNLELYNSLEANSSVYIDSIVAPETNINYKVTSKNDIAESKGTEEEIVLLAKPENLNFSYSDKIFNWQDKSNFEDGFIIQLFNSMSDDFAIIDSLNTDATDYFLEDSLNDGVYECRIHAFNNFGRSDFSDNIQLESVAPPTDFRAIIAFKPKTINISWNNNSEIAQNLVLRRSYNGIDFNVIDTLDSDVDTYSLTDGNINETFIKFRLHALGSSARSKSMETEIIFLNTPQAFEGTYENNTLSFSWQDQSDFEEGFTIQLFDSISNDFVYFDSLAANTTYTNLEDSLNEGLYQFRIHAFNNFGRSDFSDTLEIEIISPPTNFNADISFQPKTVNLSWNNNSDIAQSLVLNRSYNGTDFNVIDTLESDIDTYSLTEGNINETITTFKLRALGSISSSLPVSSDIIFLNKPDNFVGEYQDSTLSLSWLDTSDFEEGFVIERILEDGDKHLLIDSIDSDKENFSLQNIDLFTSYRFRIHAYKENYKSDYALLANPIITSSKEISKEKISIYPNPIDNYLMLDIFQKSNEQTAFIVDNSGRIVLRFNLKGNNQHKINLTGLPPGIYLIVFRDNENNLVKSKFVKK